MLHTKLIKSHDGFRVRPTTEAFTMWISNTIWWWLGGGGGY